MNGIRSWPFPMPMKTQNFYLIALLLISLVEWTTWTEQSSYLRLLFSMDTGTSFFVACLLLALSLVVEARSNLVADVGAWISYRFLTTERLLRLPPSTINAYKNIFLVSLAAIALILVLVTLPVLTSTNAYPKWQLTAAYFFAQLYFLTAYLFVPNAYNWEYETPLCNQWSGVLRTNGQLIYVEDRRTNTWRLARGAFAVLLDSRARIFNPTYHLRRVVQLSIDTPIFGGVITFYFNPRPEAFPDVLTANEMTLLEPYTLNNRQEVILQMALNNFTDYFAETVNVQFNLASFNTNLHSDAIAHLKAGFSNILRAVKSIDASQIEERLSLTIQNDVFGDRPDASSLFDIRANVGELTFTTDFQQVRQMMMGITQQLAAANLSMQQNIYDQLLAMMPMLANTTLEDPADMIGKFKSLLSVVQGQSTTAPTVPPAPQLPPSIPESAIRKSLTTARQLVPNASWEDMKTFVERELRKMGVLATDYRLKKEHFDQFYYGQ